MKNDEGAVSNDRPSWPLHGLESVGRCPACGGGERELLYHGLTDRTFGCAPGTWEVYQCGRCCSSYLDPRPTADTLLLAYARYYTHRGGRETPAAPWRRWREALGNGYRNWRHGTKFRPACALGVPIAWLMPNLREALDFDGRHLPPKSGGGRLLDVGFGDGRFLELARSIGWEVAGVDFDPQTVEKVRALGFDVRLGGIEVFDDSEGCFDVITISHVIEHVHDPEQLLRDAYRLLKGGGVLWVETPNVEAYGHLHFGRHWRGLEVPRHLVVFSRSGLRGVLRRIGFQRLEERVRFHCYATMAVQSRAIAKGMDPACARPSLVDRFIGHFVALGLLLSQRRSEFITILGWKPDR